MSVARWTTHHDILHQGIDMARQQRRKSQAWGADYGILGLSAPACDPAGRDRL